MTTLPSHLFDMDAVAALLRERGIDAEVGMSGGGCATLYTGQRDAEGYRTMACGIGTYLHRDYGRSVAYWDEFWIGSDRDEEIGHEVTARTVEALADEIAAMHRDLTPCPECDTTTCARRPGYPYCYGA